VQRVHRVQRVLRVPPELPEVRVQRGLQALRERQEILEQAVLQVPPDLRVELELQAYMVRQELAERQELLELVKQVKRGRPVPQELQRRLDRLELLAKRD